VLSQKSAGLLKQLPSSLLLLELYHVDVLTHCKGMERLGDREAEKSGSAFKQIPLQRYGSVKEIADGTVYLFSDAGNYVNGEVLVIDGGSWRAPSAMMGGLRQYPDYLLDDTYMKQRATQKAKL
jgi:peroxisomal 2,4-dienoyl-CoA reductase